MKEVLSLFTFGIGALFFVVFFAAFKPDCRHCSDWTEQARLLRHESFVDPRLPIAHPCRSDVAWSRQR